MAVRPTAALLNHSCWPNTLRCSVGGAVVLMAAVDIKPGEEVNDNDDDDCIDKSQTGDVYLQYTESFHDPLVQY